jgi:hypothetical protein
MTTDNFCFYLQNRLVQTSQTGGQQYSDTSLEKGSVSDKHSSFLLKRVSYMLESFMTRNQELQFYFAKETYTKI